MAKKTTAVATTDSSVESFIKQAMDTKAPIETLERLIALRGVVKKEMAEEAFVIALADFQEEVPVIEKKKAVMNTGGNSVRYKYAPMEDIVAQIKKAVAENGFSYSWDSKLGEGRMQVTCKLQHRQGHFQTSTIEIPIAEGGFMTEPQKYASAQTYAKRYTLLNVLGISTADEDTDATDVKKDKVPLSDKAKIIFLLRQLKRPTKTAEEVTKSVMEITELELVEANYKKIIQSLEYAIKENEEFEKSQSAGSDVQ